MYKLMMILPLFFASLVADETNSDDTNPDNLAYQANERFNQQRRSQLNNAGHYPAANNLGRYPAVNGAAGAAAPSTVIVPSQTSPTTPPPAPSNGINQNR